MSGEEEGNNTNGANKVNGESSSHNENNNNDVMAIHRAKSKLTYREDIHPGLMAEMSLKRTMLSTESQFQQIDVIETYFGKTLVTDGKTQSTQFDEFAYHESLVHPPLFRAITSRAEKDDDGLTVFIGGGAELATAREALRHKSVKKLIMVDIDGELVDICKKHLPEWGQDCTKDDRMELIIGDAHEYIIAQVKERSLDVIIMDISDPIEAGPGIKLYTKEFYEEASKRLKLPHGVFVTQAGTADAIPPPHFYTSKDGRDTSCFGPITNTLQSVFPCVTPYTMNIPSFGGDWGFVMAFQTSTQTNDEKDKDDKQAEKKIKVSEKEKEAEKQWKTMPPEKIDELITDHITGGADKLRQYDGTTHQAMFALSKDLRKYLKSDDRIMTSDNPIFMY